MVQGDLHDSCDAESVNVPHAEVLDAQALQEVAAGNDQMSPNKQKVSLKHLDGRSSLLSRVHVPQSDVHQVP